jgi:PAS domain S-box-containing protein
MLNVLLIDDRPTNRKLLRQLTLQIDERLEIFTFENGLEALNWTKDKGPDLVITDYNMPEMNGAEFIEAFRAIPEYVNIPVIVLTAHEDKDYRMRALEAGATDFLLRPIDHYEFKVRVRNLLTLRKQQLALEERGERKLKAFLDTIPAIICANEPDGKISFANKYMMDLLNVREEQCIGFTLDDVFKDKSFERSFAQRFNEALNRPFEETLTSPSGDSRTFITTRIALNERYQDLDEEIVVSVDITDRKQAEQKFKEQGQYFRHVIDSDPNLIFAHDEKGRITLANKGLADLCESTPHLLRDQNIDTLPLQFGPVQNKKRQVYERDGQELEATVFTQQVVQPDGANLWFQTVQTKLEPKQGHVPETLNVMSDITQLMQQAEELATAKEEAESANWSKTEFLANMSHELRTPLNAIINFSDMMRSEILGPLGTGKYKEYSTDIHESGQHLLNIINDILDISKIESGQMGLKKEKLRIKDTVESVLRILDHRIEDASLKLTAEYNLDSSTIYADEVKLKQILFNLITNCIKFTPANGKIFMIARSDQRNLYIEVRDTGIGIENEDIEQALKRFGQLEGHLTRQHSGAGLGLSLVKGYVEMHGGSFSLESQVGEGTVARFELPLSESTVKSNQSADTGISESASRQLQVS